MLGMLTALAPFTIDTYLPAFPRIAADFGARDSAAEQTLAATMVGFAVGQLVIGPWSDRVGRRRPLLVGLTVHVIASLLAFAAPTFWFFVMARIVEGAGAAAGTVLALAIARDKYSGQPLVNALGRIALVSGVAPLIAPVLGSQAVQLANWRWIFVLLGAYGVAMLILTAIYLPETRPEPIREAVQTADPGRVYQQLLRHRTFDGILVVAGMRFTVLFAYLQVSPFILQSDYRLSVGSYAMILAANSIGMFVGVQLSTRLTRWVSPTRVLSSSLVLLLFAGAAVLITGEFVAPVGAVIAGFSALMFACGLGLPMIQSLGLQDHPADAGAAAALVSATGFGAAGLLSPLVNLPASLGASRTVSLGTVILVGTAVAALTFAATRTAKFKDVKWDSVSHSA